MQEHYTEIEIPEMCSFCAEVVVGERVNFYPVKTAITAASSDDAFKLLAALYGRGNVQTPVEPGEVPWLEVKVTTPAGTDVTIAIHAEHVDGAKALLYALNARKGIGFSTPIARRFRPALVTEKVEVEIGGSGRAWTEMLVGDTRHATEVIEALYGPNSVRTMWHKSI